MLDHLRRRVIDLLASVTSVTLSTYGPAGIQAQVLPSIALGLRFFVLVPLTSEHLYNLEQEQSVVVTTATWQLHGQGKALSEQELPADIPLPYASRQIDFAVVEIKPIRLQIGQPNGGGFSETIDIIEDSSAAF